MEPIVVFITTASREEAERIGRMLVERRLAACVNIVPAVTSFFWWEGRIASESETLMIVKTSRGRFGDLSAAVSAQHSYSVPEIIALPIIDGVPAYLAWLKENLL